MSTSSLPLFYHYIVSHCIIWITWSRAQDAEHAEYEASHSKSTEVGGWARTKPPAGTGTVPGWGSEVKTPPLKTVSGVKSPEADPHEESRPRTLMTSHAPVVPCTVQQTTSGHHDHPAVTSRRLRHRVTPERTMPLYNVTKYFRGTAAFEQRERTRGRR